MATYNERPICGLCRLIHHARMDDDWPEGPFDDPQRDREYEYLCPECYGVVVDGQDETRDWILEQYPVTA